MPWRYSNPMTFPASFHEAFRYCEATGGLESFYLAETKTRGEALAIADRFRHFRWCLRRQPEAHSKLSAIESDYRFRTSIGTYAGGNRYAILLFARPANALFVHNADLLSSID